MAVASRKGSLTLTEGIPRSLDEHLKALGHPDLPSYSSGHAHVGFVLCLLPAWSCVAKSGFSTGRTAEKEFVPWGQSASSWQGGTTPQSGALAWTHTSLLLLLRCI